MSRAGESPATQSPPKATGENKPPLRGVPQDNRRRSEKARSTTTSRWRNW